VHVTLRCLIIAGGACVHITQCAAHYTAVGTANLCRTACSQRACRQSTELLSLLRRPQHAQPATLHQPAPKEQDSTHTAVEGMLRRHLRVAMKGIPWIPLGTGSTAIQACSNAHHACLSGIGIRCLCDSSSHLGPPCCWAML
jgi:hypothetical protein